MDLKSDAFVYDAHGRTCGQEPTSVAAGRTLSAEAMDREIRKHAPLVRRLAHQMIARLPANVELDDMVQAGMIGLMDAIGRYEESQGTVFEAYATSRIRGAMLDELRANDWLPRSARKSQRDIENAIHRIEGRLKRAPTEAEIARELGIGVAQYQEMLSDARGAQLIYFDDLGSGDDNEDYLERHVADEGNEPGDILRDKRFRSALVQAIEDLPERERQLMGMYYEQDMNLREIGAVMGVTESRVCQLHSQAVARLRARLKQW